jgi:3-isopropylmalate dehydrogenase
MREYRVAAIGGDGVGPEVVREGVKVVEALAADFGFACRFAPYPHGASHYLKTRELLPAAVIAEMRQMDAILVGAVGDPRVEVGLLERAIVGGLRVELDLYANLRPIRLYAEHLCPIKEKAPPDIDLLVVRENTEDLYAGIGGFFKKGTADEIALQELVCTRKGTERIIRYAFDRARERGRRRPRVTLVDRANAIRAHDLWTRTFAEVGEEYPDVEKDHAYVDACAMWMVKNPGWFDVIVTTNVFGDILSDLGAILQGGLGLAASANVHPGRASLFKPIHGAAPKFAGQNKVNPLAAIASVQMMLEALGETDAAEALERAIESLLVSRRVPSGAMECGLATNAIGDLVVAELRGGEGDTAGG